MTSPDKKIVAPPDASLAETTLAARAGAVLFRNRSWIPVLFIGIPLLWRGNTSVSHWLIGGILILAGEAIRLTGVAAAGSTTRRRSRTVKHLVTHGIFAWSRNPLYTGNFLIWIGFVVTSGVMWFLPVAVLLFAAEYGLIVRYEEGVLETTFGRKYLDYRRCTPRWFPEKPDTPVEGEHDWRQALRSETSTLMQYAVLILALIVKERFELGV